MTQVKLISSWSRPGGGTIANIGLANLLNKNGIDCTFYGPHDWHLSQCNGNLLKEATITEEDTIITHFIQVPAGVKWKRHVLSCHETTLFPLKEMPLAQYDVIHFVSNSQKNWQGVNHPSVIIPPVVTKLQWTNPNNKYAGIVGSIDHNKQTHLSIQRAVKDGYKALLFGDITDLPYFNRLVSPLVDKGSATLMGHEDDREEMYSHVSCVYHTSLRETYGLVEVECKLAGIPFNGPSNNQEILEEEEIFERWKKCLNL